MEIKAESEGEERGGEGLRGKERGGEGLRGKERGRRECKRAEANEKQLTSFPCRGKKINKWKELKRMKNTTDFFSFQ